MVARGTGSGRRAVLLRARRAREGVRGLQYFNENADVQVALVEELASASAR